MLKLKTSDYIVYCLAIIGSIYGLIEGNILFGSAFLALAALYTSISLFGYLLILTMLLTSTSMYDLLYVVLIGYYVYTNWIEGKKPLEYVSVGNLSTYHQQYYANVFLVIIGLNIVIRILSTGSVFSATSFIFLITMLTSTLMIFSCWLIAKKVYEASYFYIGYLILLSISSFILANSFSIFSLNPFLIIEMLLMMIISIMYIIRHK